MTSVNQGLSSLAGGGKMRDPGNEVGTPRLWDVIRGNSCMKSPGCIHLIAFVDLVRDRKGQ